MSRVYILSVIAIVIVLVFFSGCIESEYKTDLFVAKFHGNGTLAWVQVIDSSQNDEAVSINETSDGGYLITGDVYESRCNNYGYYPAVTPVQIQLSSKGQIGAIVNYSGRYNAPDHKNNPYSRTGWFDFVPDDGGHLSTYQKAKGNAVYYRIEKTDAYGKILWDTPFLTVKRHSVYDSIRENIFIQGIVPTSDRGYIVWGYRERAAPC
jgi:hypothetical protein